MEPEYFFLFIEPEYKAFITNIRPDEIAWHVLIGGFDETYGENLQGHFGFQNILA